MRRREIRAEPVPALLGDPPRECAPPPNATACEPGWDADLGPAATFTVEGEGDFAVALATFAMTPRRNASAPLGARVVQFLGELHALVVAFREFIVALL